MRRDAHHERLMTTRRWRQFVVSVASGNEAMLREAIDGLYPSEREELKAALSSLKAGEA